MYTLQQDLESRLVRYGVNFDKKGQILRIFHGWSVTIHFNGPTSFSLSYIGGITQGAGVGIYEVAGRANDLDGTDEVGYRASKGQSAGM
jgi:hypothetical protein